MMIRVIGIAVSVIGFGGIFLIKLLLDLKFQDFVNAYGFVPVSHDNFYLFFDFSTIICAVLLALTLLSAATYIFQKDKPSKFAFLTVSVSPILCMAAILMVSGFYAYLTHGSEFTMWYWLLTLGFSETLLFALPFTLIKAHKVTVSMTEAPKPKKRSRK